MVTLDTVRNNYLIRQYMQIGNNYIGTIGAIEHNLNHAELISRICGDLLLKLGYSEREAQLGEIAGYLHDIGNLVNRYGHGMSGAIMAFHILLDMDMDPGEIATIIGAIGNHEEHTQGSSVNNVAAALILADKSDVHRSRVRKRGNANFTQRDRVNYAVTDTELIVEPDRNTITLKINIDIAVCSVMEYFEIFLTKMLMSKKASEYLKCKFRLIINDHQLL